jgi:hypothetical protein
LSASRAKEFLKGLIFSFQGIFIFASEFDQIESTAAFSSRGIVAYSLSGAASVISLGQGGSVGRNFAVAAT